MGIQRMTVMRCPPCGRGLNGIFKRRRILIHEYDIPFEVQEGSVGREEWMKEPRWIVRLRISRWLGWLCESIITLRLCSRKSGSYANCVLSQNLKEVSTSLFVSGWSRSKSTNKETSVDRLRLCISENYCDESQSFFFTTDIFLQFVLQTRKTTRRWLPSQYGHPLSFWPNTQRYMVIRPLDNSRILASAMQRWKASFRWRADTLRSKSPNFRQRRSTKTWRHVSEGVSMVRTNSVSTRWGFTDCSRFCGGRNRCHGGFGNDECNES